MSEYSALHNGALVFDRSDRFRIRISGDKAADLVTGMVTNDVASLQPGEGQYAAALSPKGKIVADLRIFRLADSLLIDTAKESAEAWRQMVRKYINPRAAPYHDVSGELTDVALFGPSSRKILAQLGLDDKSAAAPYANAPAEVDGAAVIIARVPEMDLDGYEIFAPAAAASAVRERLFAAGARTGGDDTWEIARIEGGRPRFGVDMDENTLPQEANFDELGAISYTKGCYIGQETVARIHFRGHVNRFLRRLRFVARPAPPRGTELLDDEGKTVGDVRSVALSPRLGGVGIGMVRREVAAGTTLRAKWPDGECAVQVEQNEKGATV